MNNIDMLIVSHTIYESHVLTTILNERAIFVVGFHT